MEHAIVNRSVKEDCAIKRQVGSGFLAENCNAKVIKYGTANKVRSSIWNMQDIGKDKR